MCLVRFKRERNVIGFVSCSKVKWSQPLALATSVGRLDSSSIASSLTSVNDQSGLLPIDTTGPVPVYVSWPAPIETDFSIASVQWPHCLHFGLQSEQPPLASEHVTRSVYFFPCSRIKLYCWSPTLLSGSPSLRSLAHVSFTAIFHTWPILTVRWRTRPKRSRFVLLAPVRRLALQFWSLLSCRAKRRG